MNRSIIPLLCSFLLFSASSSSAFDITKILSQYPEYSNFNDLITKTGLANEINTKTTITLLAIPNGAIGGLTSKPNDVAKNILTTHIVLDYFDTIKLQNLKDKTTKLTTMFQQSGKATNDQGFLNVTTKDNAVVFGSAVVGAQHDSRLEKSVMNQPYNISILGISQPIVTPGIDAPLAPSPAQPANANAPKGPVPLAPAPAAPAKPIAPKVLPPKAESPVHQDTVSPKAESPASSKNAASPTADSPVAADVQTPSPSPSSSSSSSSAEKMKVSFGLFVILASMVMAY